jgi:hypothetical protein
LKRPTGEGQISNSKRPAQPIQPASPFVCDCATKMCPDAVGSTFAGRMRFFSLADQRFNAAGGVHGDVRFTSTIMG